MEIKSRNGGVECPGDNSNLKDTNKITRIASMLISNYYDESKLISFNLDTCEKNCMNSKKINKKRKRSGICNASLPRR